MIFLQIHVVSSGETLFSISRAYGVAPGFLARCNGLTEPYRLAVGQSLLVLTPTATAVVEPGDTLDSIARQSGLSLRALLRLNPNLAGQTALFPGQVLITATDDAPSTPASLFGYAYPYVDRSVLAGILPYAGALMPFTYGFTAAGELVDLDDAALLTLARAYRVRPILHLSTLTEDGTFSAARAAAVLNDPAAQDALIANVIAQVKSRGYQGVDADFEYLGAALAPHYAAFLRNLRAALLPLGYPLLAALAPKTSRTQPGLLYESHDYAAIAQSVDFVLLMTYEWGYTYGPPQAVAPLPSVRKVLNFALSEIPNDQIFLGFPNYGYDWPLPYVAGQTRAESIGNDAAVQRAVAVGATIQFDEISQSPYFHYTDNLGVIHEVWFEDVRSSLAKFSLLPEYALRGLGYWNFMRPFTANFALLNAMFRLSGQTLLTA